MTLLKNKAETDGNRFVYLASAVSALGGLLFGYDIGVISGAILFITKDFALSSGMEEIVVSAVLLGALLGAAGGGILPDRLGRRRLLIGAALVFGLGALGAALAPGPRWLIAARVVAGAAIGIASFVAPLYISEIAPVAIRGWLVSINQVALTSGIVISYVIDYAFAPSEAWRWMFALAEAYRAVGGVTTVPRTATRRRICRGFRTFGQKCGEASDRSSPALLWTHYNWTLAACRRERFSPKFAPLKGDFRPESGRSAPLSGSK